MTAPPPETVLVTGAAGFLGSAVTRALLDRGLAVIAFDRDFALERLPDHPALERVTGDVRDEAAVRALVQRAHRVVHFAAVAGVHAYIERPLEVLDVNLLGTRHLLQACLDAGVPILLASTSEVFGKNPDLLREDGDTWLGPTTHARWCYATSKIAGEHYAWAMVKLGLVAAAVRYFNVYGPLLDAPGTGRVISQFLGRIRDREPLVLVDGGHAVRCLLYIDDAVRATVELALALRAGSALVGRPFNVGNPEPVSMAQLADEVIRLSGHPHGTVDVAGERFFGPGFEDIPHRVPDTSALEAAIGFRAQVPLVEGLRRTLAHWGMLADATGAPRQTPIPVIRPCYDADERLVSRFRRSLHAGWTTNHGPHTRALEEEAAAWLGVEPVLAVASGAAGLEVGLKALDRAGAALLPAFTYIATLNAVEAAGLRPVLVDIEPDRFTLDPGDLARKLAATPDAAVVVPVNVYGVPPDLGAIRALADAHGCAVVYDAAHGLGTAHGEHLHDPRPDVTVYSLHATKILPAIEGGLVHARSPEVVARARALRTHGLTPDPLDALRGGLNGKIDELSAATARHGLARLDAILARRRAYATRLRAVMAARPDAFTLQAVPPGVVPNGQNLCVRVHAPLDAVAEVLEGHGVGWRRYFDPPLHHLRRLPRAELPRTDEVWGSLVSLPLHSRMDEATLRRIEAALRAVPAG